MGRRLIMASVAVFIFGQMQGSSAVTPVFVKKGDDLLLNVTEADVPEDFHIFYWRFYNKSLVTFLNQSKPKVSKIYTGRVETSVEKFSVKLKNLQEADSGVYTARVMALKDIILAEYNVTVQAPVSPVGLTVSNSSDSCNLTVTCRTQDSNISSTFTCDTQTCSQEGGERPEASTSGASLHVYVENGSIICNHSNQVSWTRNMTNIRDSCRQHAGFPPLVQAILGIVLILCIVGLLYFPRRIKNKRESIKNTDHASQGAQPGDPLITYSKGPQSGLEGFSY